MQNLSSSFSDSSTEETIAAIATPPGPGGIGIIRISGPLAIQIFQKLFLPRYKTAPQKYDSHRMYYGWIMDHDRGSPVDEVLGVFMQAPNTYTREDVVEIQCHGSYLVLQEILSLVIANGARLAAPGEFTKRAFLNGRLDLTQAEAVIDLIEARTDEGRSMAVGQLQGLLHEEVAAIQEKLVAMRAVIEVAIDFPEDETDILDHARLKQQLKEDIEKPLRELIARADEGKIYREGISAVILGRPNVGKSSLLNTLLEEDRALVTPVPGTTRDTIEEFINIKGMPVRIVDTAGIRHTSETVEELGIQRARAKLADAELVLFMLDASEPLTKEDLSLYESVKRNSRNQKVLLILNKIDLAPAIKPEQYSSALGNEPLVSVSAKKHSGISELKDTIFSLITGSRQGLGWDPGATVVPNVRHKDALKKGLEACRRLETGLEADLSPDLLAIDLQATLGHLGDIVGEATTEDVLDMIFERFCIGK
ncbi:MAG: tRNA uridine-5-carboxymethylaminomethyl(34) synthesis GTPase MnmE [Deltaproteobacteria bacterium]|nr:tRNA uridine-5-carboxymethylaminomethyl(34) synthesis GTPase MnmE [Deltaproteobacteria bacterium]